LSAVFDDDDASPGELAVITWVQPMGKTREKFRLVGEVMGSSQVDFLSIDDAKATAEVPAHAAETDLSKA